MDSAAKLLAQVLSIYCGFSNVPGQPTIYLLFRIEAGGPSRIPLYTWYLQLETSCSFGRSTNRFRRKFLGKEFQKFGAALRDGQHHYAEGKNGVEQVFRAS